MTITLRFSSAVAATLNGGGAVRAAVSIRAQVALSVTSVTEGCATSSGHCSKNCRSVITTDAAE